MAPLMEENKEEIVDTSTDTPAVGQRQKKPKNGPSPEPPIKILKTGVGPSEGSSDTQIGSHSPKSPTLDPSLICSVSHSTPSNEDSPRTPKLPLTPSTDSRDEIRSASSFDTINSFTLIPAADTISGGGRWSHQQ